MDRANLISIGIYKMNAGVSGLMFLPSKFYVPPNGYFFFFLILTKLCSWHRSCLRLRIVHLV